jgi:hypothetical protein
LINIDGNYNKTHDYTLYTTKRAYMLKHFAYFHRPGSVRYDVAQEQLPEGVNAVASKLGGDWNVLFMNNQSHAYTLSMELPSKAAKPVKLVHTTDADDWKEIKALPKVRKGAVQIKLPAESFVSLRLSSK